MHPLELPNSLDDLLAPWRADDSSRARGPATELVSDPTAELVDDDRRTTTAERSAPGRWLTAPVERSTIGPVERRLGDIELLAPIGLGGMARVWMARRVLLDGVATKAVAVKILHDGSAQDAVRQSMFLDELRLSMLLNHSNIVQVFDAGVIAERQFLVMEWVDGKSLAAVLEALRRRGERLDEGVAVYITAAILRALEYAHTLRHEGRTAEIIHRDISPHNVLISVSGEVKVTDFGVARLAGEDTSGVHIKGKLRYMAPEQVEGNSRAVTVDLFAVGAILHEMLAGARLRSDQDVIALHSQPKQTEPPPPLEDVSPALDQLRRDLLHPAADARVPTAREALARLEPLVSGDGARRVLAELCRTLVGVDGPRTEMPRAPDPSSSSGLPVHSLLFGSHEEPDGSRTRTRAGAPDRAAKRLPPLGLSAAVALVVTLVVVSLLNVGGSAGQVLSRPAVARDAVLPTPTQLVDEAKPDGGPVTRASAGAQPVDRTLATLMGPGEPGAEPRDQPAAADQDASAAKETDRETDSAAPPRAAEISPPRDPPTTSRRKPSRASRTTKQPSRSKSRSKKKPALPSCGNGLCDVSLAEDCWTCAVDCGCPKGEHCVSRRSGREHACAPNEVH